MQIPQSLSLGCIVAVAAVLLGCRTTPTTDSILESENSYGVVRQTAANNGFQSTHSGLRYRVLKPSRGRIPSSLDTVKIHYRGWLDDGTEFDSSYKRGQPAVMPMAGLVPGFVEGLQLISEGGKIELEIPPELGYGNKAVGNKIPANSTLHFEIELIGIE